MGGVEHVPQGAVGWSQQRPHGARPLPDMPVLPLFPTVAQERAEQTGVGVLHQFYLHTHTGMQKDKQTCLNLLKPTVSCAHRQSNLTLVLHYLY